MDGWGMRNSGCGNAVAEADTPVFDYLLSEYPSTTLKASGEAVGLPEGQMGNSEVGHLNIGAGRIVYQEFTRISKAIKDGDFFKNSVLLNAIRAAKERGKSLHLMGLLSDGGVHSHIDHLFALLDLAAKEGIKEVYVHGFLDGRDVPPDSAGIYVKQLEEKLKKIRLGKIATIMGRYYAMDRDNRWERTQRAYKAMVLGEGITAVSAASAIQMSYEKREMDEFVQPAVIVDEKGAPISTIEHGDSIIFFNFRADRARQITRAFVDKDFTHFNRPKGFLDPQFVCMTQYDKEIKAPVAFPPQNLVNTLGEVLAEKGIRQLRVAETEKYAHVTFFFNGGVEEPNEGEDRILVPSPKVPTYNLKPEMSAFEVAEKVVKAVEGGSYGVIIVNFANPDMVGHTGIMEAAVKAVEAVDTCLGKIFEAVKKAGGIMIVTADHGNAELMYEREGEPHTAHTCGEVPFIIAAFDEELKKKKLRKDGSLRDIAPTILELLKLPKPIEMTGSSLILD